jgi:hypothetical protein
MHPKVPLERIIRFTLEQSRDFRGVVLFKLLEVLTLLLKPPVAISYDNSSKPDGVGAQIQRLLAIRSLTKNLGLGYVHSGVASVAVHPLDPYQTPAEFQEFINELNSVFFINNYSDFISKDSNVIRKRTLSFQFLFQVIFSAKFFSKNTLVLCVEPYAVSDFDPNNYSGILQELPNFQPIEFSKLSLGIHYRRGVGGMAVQKGEKISRELPVKYFVGLANELVQDQELAGSEIIIYTDAPSVNLRYEPPANQLELWEQSPRFSNGIMDVLGVNHSDEFNALVWAPRIVQGGDPIQAIRELAGLDILIMSRSSFSYIGAILNPNGDIYFPKSFWHPPLKGWHIVNEAKLEI